MQSNDATIATLAIVALWYLKICALDAQTNSTVFQLRLDDEKRLQRVKSTATYKVIKVNNIHIPLIDTAVLN